MHITPNTLIRAAGIAAVMAGMIVIGVQVGHPQLDAETITTTEMIVGSPPNGIAMVALGTSRWHSTRTKASDNDATLVPMPTTAGVR